MASTSIVSFENINDNYNPSNNVSRPIMSKYEKTKVLGVRIEQLSRGARSLVDLPSSASMRDIAIAELEQKKMPFVIIRTMPNGLKEYWKINDMIVLP